MRSDRSIWFLASMLVVTLFAFALRSVDLGNRPMHGDEAVHAEKFRELWEKGIYRYDSNEYHGPTIYYAALPSVILHGRHNWPDTREADYRLPIAIFGSAMLVLLLPLAPALGRKSTLVGAIFIAISPAFVFYSRYFIQEIPFVFFTLGMIAAGWRYAQTQSRLWLMLTGLSAGLMVASKETAVLSLLAMGAAILLTVAYTRRRDGRKLDIFALVPVKDLAIATFIALLVSCFLVSGLFKNPAGPLDYLRAYLPWFHRARGDSVIHNEPFFHYLSLLIYTHKQYQGVWGGVWSEGLIVVLALVGAIVAFSLKSPTIQKEKKFDSRAILWRFVAFYTITLTLIYSAIPYKTPWCLLSFYLGFCLLAGLGVVTLLTRLPGVPLRVLGRQLYGQAYRASFVSNADPNNPYVYAATSADVLKFQKRIDDIAKAWPAHNQILIKVFGTSNYYWPLPWYLRRYPNVGYYPHAPATKKEAAADITVCDTALDEPLTALLGDDDLMNGINEVRPRTFFVETFIRMDVWTTYLNAGNGGVTKKFVPPPPAE